MSQRILVTGATGFVGSRLVDRLLEEGISVLGGSRSHQRAAKARPDIPWVHFNLDDPVSVDEALRGVTAAVYLVHLMADGPGYAERERAAARRFARLAAENGVERIVYLGGVAPAGPPSEHLQSRLDTGRILREGRVPCLELRAGMIIGQGSESWKIVRDLSSRLPVMLLPRWLSSRSCPVAIDDVITGLHAALTLPLSGSRVFELPGPETLSAKDILIRVARLRGMEPKVYPVPVLTPQLSSYWLKLVSRADFAVAQELVHGLEHDLIPTGTPLWDELPGFVPTPFDDAVAAASLDEAGPSTLKGRVLERLARRLAAKSPQ